MIYVRWIFCVCFVSVHMLPLTVKHLFNYETQNTSCRLLDLRRKLILLMRLKAGNCPL